MNGSNSAQVTSLTGFFREAPYATFGSGNRGCPFASRLDPSAAAVHGVSNSVGTALVYVYPYGGFALMIAGDKPSTGV